LSAARPVLAVAQPLGPAGHHPLAVAQAGGDRHPVVAVGGDLHRPQVDLAVLDHEHGLAARPADQGRPGHRGPVGGPADRDGRGGRHPDPGHRLGLARGASLGLAEDQVDLVGDPAGGRLAGRGGDRDPADLGREGGLGERVQLHPGELARLDQRDVGLVDLGRDQQVADVVHGGHGLAGGDLGADPQGRPGLGGLGPAPQALEGLLGRLRFVALYVGTGLVGAGASFAFNQTTLGVGASGAIFGLLGALVAYFFRRRRAGGSVPLQNLLLVLLLNLFIASRNPSIDNLAHIGGFLAGLVAMGLFDAAGPRNRGLQAAALAVPFLAGVALAVLGVANYPPGSGLTCVGA